MTLGTVLVTSVDSTAGEGMVAALRERWGGRIRIVGTASVPRHLVAAADLLDHVAEVPTTAGHDGDPRRDRDDDADLDATDVLLTVIERTAPDLVVPLDIETVVRLAELEHLGADLLALHDPAVAEQIHDRLALADLVESASRHAHDLLCPPTTTLDRARWHRRGVFATPRFGASEGRGVVLRSEQALDRLRQQVRGPAYVAQPCCTPPTVTVDVFRSRDGGVVRAACRQRLDVGTDLGSDWRQARVFDDDELALQCGELLERLGLTGLLSLRLMRGPAEQWCLTNLAPAPSAGAPFARAAGVDLYSLFVADRLGLDPDPGWAPPLDGDRTVARRFVEHVTLATPPVGPTAADPPGTAAEQA